jgi:hypothetical protein
METHTMPYTIYHTTEITWINTGSHTHWNDKSLPCQNVWLVYLNVSERFHPRGTDISKLLGSKSSPYSLHTHMNVINSLYTYLQNCSCCYKVSPNLLKLYVKITITCALTDCKNFSFSSNWNVTGDWAQHKPKMAWHVIEFSYTIITYMLIFIRASTTKHNL